MIAACDQLTLEHKCVRRAKSSSEATKGESELAPIPSDFSFPPRKPQKISQRKYFIFYCVNLPPQWRSYRSSSKIIDWQFSRLLHLLTNGISLHSGEADTKKQKSRQAHFHGASSLDSFPSDHFALHGLRAWLKGEATIIKEMQVYSEFISLMPGPDQG